jgi:hypothetical protein
MRRLIIFVCVLGVVAMWSGAASAATANGDFNGDGFADLAIGVPGESLGTATGAGAVNILYGSAVGLTATADQFLHRDVPGVAFIAASDDEFGRSLAAGDFDGDGFSDLAVGVPGADVGGADGAGAVHVFHGSALGLCAACDKVWHQDKRAILGTSQSGDRFGYSLAAANFGRTGRMDLAIGIPEERVGGRGAAGAVQVLYGRGGGLGSPGDQRLHQDSPGIRGSAEVDDQLGRSVAAANFGKSPYADLAVTAPFENLPGAASAGAVNVLYGSSKGLSAAGDQIWHQNSNGIAGAAEAGDFFGWATAAADFGRSRRADLAVGVSNETLGAFNRAGAVNVLYGTPNGLSATGDQLWTQDSAGIAEDPETGDFFGAGLGAANFGRGSRADLAIAAVEESVGAVTQAGAVHILYGGANGLAATGAQFWHQDSADVEDMSESEDYLGESLGTGNFGNGDRADLAISAASDDLAGLIDAGGVNVLYGSPTGLSAAGDQFWHQDVLDVEDSVEAGDRFGAALAPRR